MKKTAFMALSVAVLLVSTLFALPVYGAEEGYVLDIPITANAVYLYNMDTETMIYSRDAEVPLPPASLTKIMTCILALELTPDLDKEIITYPTYVEEYLYTYQRQHGSISLGGDLRKGDTLTMRQALYALMLPSANEVAMIIADHLGGSQEGFAKMMNQRARELGAKNTSFVNPNGLYDPAHLTTAYDLAQITMHALQIPEFVNITSEIVYQSGPTNRHDNIIWKSTNQMMNPDSGDWDPNSPRSGNYYYPSIKGVKTGSVPEAGRCFISTANKDGFTYLLVIMGSDYYDEDGKEIGLNMAFVDTGLIYDEVFKTFRVQTLVDKGKHVADIPLRLSMEQDYVKLMTSDRSTALLPITTEIGNVIYEPHIPDHLEAPVKKGDHVGEVAIILDGVEMARVDLLAQESVDASPILVLLEKVLAVTRSFWFKFTIIFLILLIAFYVFLTILRNRNRRRGGYKPQRRI